jgi:hypothetical protein
MLVTLAFLLFCWTEIATGCMLYATTFPFSDSLLIEATIKDDEITACWFGMCYKEHNVLQHIVPTSHTVLKRSTSTVEPETEEVEADDETWDFREWDFDSSDGYVAQANVGLRSVEYRAHGESFWFVPDMVENWEEERWEYTLRLWCPDDGCDGSRGAKMREEEEWLIGQRGGN